MIGSVGVPIYFKARFAAYMNILKRNLSTTYITSQNRDVTSGS